MNLVRHIRFIAVLVGLMLLLPMSEGCSGRRTGTDPSNVLRFAINDDPRSMEPGLSPLLSDSIIALNLHVGLFKYDRDSILRPYLVREWGLSDNRLTYTFALHDNWKWHDGRAITAMDFKTGWERYLDPKLGAWGASYLTSIAGAHEMLNGGSTELKGVEAPDARTLRVTLAYPDPLFLLRLGATATWIAPPEAVVKGQAKWIGSPFGGGPFKFVEWQPHSRIVLKANEEFHGAVPALGRLEFLVIPDTATVLNMYRSGDLDIAPMGATELRGLKPDPVISQEIYYSSSAQLIYLGLNGARVAAFKDARVRQAFTRAINRKTICEDVLFGAWSQASEFVPPGIAGHTDEVGLSYDPAAARTLMADAGFKDGRGFPTVQLTVYGSTELTAAEALAAQLDQNLGVKVEVRRVEPGALYDGLRRGRWDAFLGGWTADYLSAEQWLYRLLHRGSETNFTGYSNDKFEELIDKAIHASTPEEQGHWWAEANRIATADAAFIPLAYGRFVFLVKPNISGFAANIFGQVEFEGVRKTPIATR